MNDYEFVESLGAHHPVTVSLTVAQAEQRERRGLPLPISGDPESDQVKELLRIRRERKAKMAAATDQSWVLVSGDTAAWLEQHGLMEALGGPNGTATSTRLFIPGQTVAKVLASPFAGVISKGEGVTIPVNSAAVPRRHSVEFVVKIQVGFARAGFKNSQHRIGGDCELDGMSRVRLQAKPDGGWICSCPPVADTADERVECGLVSPQGGVPIDHQPSHSSSPSVGAPGGAVCNNPNPTEGELDTPGEVTS